MSSDDKDRPDGNTPGARFVQNDLHYVVVEERITPHRLGDYEVDRIYFPGTGLLCVCIETGELCRLSRYSSATDVEWWKLEAKPTEIEADYEVIQMREMLETMGARRVR